MNEIEKEARKCLKKYQNDAFEKELMDNFVPKEKPKSKIAPIIYASCAMILSVAFTFTFFLKPSEKIYYHENEVVVESSIEEINHLFKQRSFQDVFIYTAKQKRDSVSGDLLCYYLQYEDRENIDKIKFEICMNKNYNINWIYEMADCEISYKGINIKYYNKITDYNEIMKYETEGFMFIDKVRIRFEYEGFGVEEIQDKFLDILSAVLQ